MIPTTASRVIESSLAAGTGGAIAKASITAAAGAASPAAATIWTIAVLGIPLGVLAAALAGSSISQLRRPAAPERRLAGAALATIADGFVGGWLAMLLLGIPATAVHIGDVVRPEVIGAVCALLVQFLRENALRYWEQIWGVVVEAVRSWFVRRGGAAPPRPGGDP